MTLHYGASWYQTHASAAKVGISRRKDTARGRVQGLGGYLVPDARLCSQGGASAGLRDGAALACLACYTCFTVHALPARVGTARDWVTALEGIGGFGYKCVPPR